MAGLVRHWFLFLDMPLYLDAFLFGTDRNSQNITCTPPSSGSALLLISGYSPVLTATSVRHCCSFLDIPLYSQPLRFGTRATFRNITCTHGHFGSALAPLSGILPVLIATSVRHSRHFSEYHLYSWPLWFGTCATFRNITCTHSHFGSALAPFSRISPVLYRLLVRHGCSFPNIPLYPYPILFGTRAIFQNLTCTHDDFVRHWLSFSDMPCTLQLR